MSSAPTSGSLVAGRVSDGGHWRLSRPSTNVVVSGGPSAGGNRRHDAELGGAVLDADGAGWVRRRGDGGRDGRRRSWTGSDEGTGAKVVSLVRMATPPMPSRSATARRARGLATSTTPTITIAAAASASTRRTAGRWTNGVTDRRPVELGHHALRQVRRAGELQAVGQLGQRALEVDEIHGHERSPASPSWVRRRSSARESRDFTVPAGTSSAAAVSASVRPAK